MVADRITVGIYALDQVLLPKPASGRGWAARLAEAAPVLAADATACPLVIAEGPEGLMLSGKPARSGVHWPDGARVQVDPVAGRAGLFLIRIGGKPAGLGSATPWTAGAAHEGPDGPELPEVLAAYAADTMIDTPDGPRAAGTLAAGDVVSTLSNGSRPLRWVGRRHVTPIEMLAHPGLRPVTFAPGTLGNSGALTVSPRQRLLIDDWRAAVYFGEDRVLVSALALVDDQAARLILPEAGIDYVVLLCDRHEVLLADGALSESFHPGETGLSGLSPAERCAMAEVVPEAELMRRRAAFPVVANAEARALRLSD
jgi:hypothetical protein